jgi:putative heme degradation protein
MLYRTEPNDPRPSFAGNPLVAAMLRENVHVADGKATIGLWGSWPFLLADVSAFGQVLAITRNAYAVLGAMTEYPEVVTVACGDRGRAVDGSLEFDFASWERAVVVVESRPGGWLYAVEFSDRSGEVIHKICLTEQSDFEAFRRWVELNQTSCKSPGAGSMRQASWLENSLMLSASGAARLRTEVLGVLFELVVARRSAFQVMVGNEGAVQAVCVGPTVFSKNGQWIFAGEEMSGIHLRVDRLADIYLQEIGESLALKACDPEGHLVCAVMVADDADLSVWNKGLWELTKRFPADQT